MKHFFVLVALLFAFEQGEVYGQVTMETFKSKSQTESKRYFSSRMDEAKAKEKSGDLKEAIFIYTALTKESMNEADRKNLYNALEIAQIKFNSYINNKVSEMIVVNDNIGIRRLLLNVQEEMTKNELDRQTQRLWTNVLANANQYASGHEYDRLSSLFAYFTPTEFGCSLLNNDEKLMPAKSSEYRTLYEAFTKHKDAEERKILEAKAKADSIQSAKYYANYRKERRKVRWHSKGIIFGSFGTLLDTQNNYEWEAGLGAQIRTTNSFIGFELTGSYAEVDFTRDADEFIYQGNPRMSYVRIAPKIMFVPFKNKSYGLHLGYTVGIPVDRQNIITEKKMVNSVCATLSLGMVKLNFEHILNTPNRISQVGYLTKGKSLNVVSASLVFYL